MASSSDPNRTSSKRSRFCPCIFPFSDSSPKSIPLQPADIVGESNIVRSRGIDPTQSENSLKDIKGSGSHDKSSSLPRDSTEEAPNMALDKTINKGDPAPDNANSSPINSQTSESKPSFKLVVTSHNVSSTSHHAQSQDHPISSPAEASNSNAKLSKLPEQSISASQVGQSQSNNPPITEDLGIQDSQSDMGRGPDTPIPESFRDEEPHSSYLNEEDYGREEDYDQEQDYDSEQDYGSEQGYHSEQDYDQEQKNGKEQKHGKKQKPSNDSTASGHSYPDSTATVLVTDRLVAIDFTVYRTE
ncbi:copii coat assembly sec16 [Fusarium pseudocircinatum]|uniref:Copii coat assembly sec16 n=1 Tax=Fusarium pseudocircinatum TaxID=56676 RepID=A0A8H5L9X8_9HYPO|nr:copii coat assembly sec16 [Fusarium pseudocircinatum]